VDVRQNTLRLGCQRFEADPNAIATALRDNSTRTKPEYANPTGEVVIGSSCAVVVALLPLQNATRPGPLMCARGQKVLPLTRMGREGKEQPSSTPPCEGGEKRLFGIWNLVFEICSGVRQRRNVPRRRCGRVCRRRAASSCRSHLRACLPIDDCGRNRARTWRERERPGHLRR
jgi:hypothetical protein